jgi:uncharacterized membrane protein YvbJ
MYCQKCGAENPVEAIFCRECGTQISVSGNQILQETRFTVIESVDEPKWLIKELNQLLNK